MTRAHDAGRRIFLLGTLGAAAGCASKARPQPAPAAQTSQASQASPTTTPSAKPAAAEIANGPRQVAKIALTFHGDGDPRIADQVLRTAEQHHARVTVLAVGTWLDQHPEMAKRILDGGHELGNHTEHHLDIDKMSADAAYAEIKACADRLTKITNTAGRWFRPSQAQHATPLVIEQARRAGYETVLSYDLDSLDWTDPGVKDVTGKVLTAQNGSIVSMHFGHPQTATAMPAILEGLHRRGLTPVTASELVA